MLTHHASTVSVENLTEACVLRRLQWTRCAGRSRRGCGTGSCASQSRWTGRLRCQIQQVKPHHTITSAGALACASMPCNRCVVGAPDASIAGRARATVSAAASHAERGDSCSCSSDSACALCCAASRVDYSVAAVSVWPDCALNRFLTRYIIAFLISLQGCCARCTRTSGARSHGCSGASSAAARCFQLLRFLLLPFLLPQNFRTRRRRRTWPTAPLARGCRRRA